MHHLHYFACAELVKDFIYFGTSGWSAQIGRHPQCAQLLRGCQRPDQSYT